MPDLDANLTIEPRPEHAPLRASYLIVDDFLPLDLAEAMRKDIDAHFGTPHRQSAATHQVWNYWFAPPLYTYFRTTPEKIIAPPRAKQFMDALRSWSCKTLGMATIIAPTLSLYVSGCRQGLHNDARNGRFGFVYSLTRNERKTSGGETIIFHEGDLFRINLGKAAAGGSFYTAVSPRFNRLVVFDDRIPHAVEQVEGSMDPVEGRFVLHGHLADGGSIVTGALPGAAVVETVAGVLQGFAAELDAARAGVFHGPLVVRLLIAPSGQVRRCDLIVDRVKRLDGSHPGPESHIAKLQAKLSALAFPSSAGETSATLPLVFGGDVRAPGKT